MIYGTGDSYLQDLSTRDLMRFMAPAEISDQVTVNWASHDIPGRTAPIVGYVGNGPRMISFTLDLGASVAAEFDSGAQTGAVGPDDYVLALLAGQSPDRPLAKIKVEQLTPGVLLQMRVAFLRSLIYPEYSENFAFPPHVCLLSLAGFYCNRVIVTECTPSYRRPYDQDGLPMVVSLQLGFQEVPAAPYGWVDVLNRQTRWTAETIKGLETTGSGASEFVFTPGRGATGEPG